MVTAFASPQDILDARDTRPTATVYVGGVTVDAVAWDAQFDVDGTATAKITVALPRPECVQPNAVVEIQGGHNGYVGTLFSGRLPAWKSSVTNRGLWLDIRPTGWTSLLAFRSRFDLTYDGPLSIAALFDSLCARYGVPSYVADDVTDPSGTIPLTLGGNPRIDGGRVVIPATQTPLSFLRSACEPFGYRIYDTPTGVVRLSRVSGLPASDPVVTFTEGVHPFSEESSYDISKIVNYPDIQGPTYEDEWGASIPIRAFPGTVEASDLIPVNDGVTYQDRRNSMLVTQQMAEIALAVAQIDGNAPETPVRWEAVAVPGVSVGDVVGVTAPTIEASGSYWLTSLDIGSDMVASYDGWAGAGEALPSGNNLSVTRIQTGVTHLGDETRSNYAVPSPNGTTSTTKVWDIEIPERATAVALRFWHHGTNSQVQGGVETDLEVSMFEVWLPGVDMDDEDNRPETSGKLAILDEELRFSRDYTIFDTDDDDNVTNPGYWKPGAVNLDRLDASAYKVRLRAGNANGYDDFEIRLIDLHVYGVAEPVVIPAEVP